LNESLRLRESKEGSDSAASHSFKKTSLAKLSEQFDWVEKKLGRVCDVQEVRKLEAENDLRAARRMRSTV
jgi:hypothetical protein